MNIKNLVVFGDSHVAALRKGLDNLAGRDGFSPETTITMLPLCRGGVLRSAFFHVRDGAIHFDDCMIDRLPDTGGTTIYCFSGNAHTARVVREINWSSHAPAPVAKYETPISAAMLRDIFSYDQRYMLTLLDTMRQLGLQVFIVEAPHLFRHNAVFAKARKEVLLHIDREYRAFIRHELAQRNVDLVSVPEACLDDEGFMLDKYRSPKAGDNHHANPRFGEVMMGEILAYLKKAG